MSRIKNINIWLCRISFFTVLLFITDIVCFSQSGSIQTDTTKASQKINESAEATQTQTQTQSQTQIMDQNQPDVQKAASGKAIKQVKSAKPDMSKARGARPNIIRPSGSNIPKGAGKPGGARRIGGR